MNAKIKAALLGDAAAAAACTAAGIAIPCPWCGEIPGWYIAGDGNDLLSFGCQGANNCVRWIIPFSPPYHTNALQIALGRWNRRVPVQTEDNPPFTLDELREMDGEPIWYANKKGAEWCILRVVNGVYFAQSGGSNNCAADADTYGKTWLAYRRKPEEGKHE